MPRSAATEACSAAFRAIVGDGSSVLFIGTTDMELQRLLDQMHTDTANRMPTALAASILFHYYSTTLSPQGIKNLARGARIVEVERGVVLRIATVPIKKPATLLLNYGYDVGHTHVIRYRAEERRSLVERIDTLKRQKGMRSRLLRQTAEDDLRQLDYCPGWQTF